MSQQPERKPSVRRAPLVAAAQAQGGLSTAAAGDAPPSLGTAPTASGSTTAAASRPIDLTRAASVSTMDGTLSNRSTPSLPDGASRAPVQAPQKLKFRPSKPVRPPPVKAERIEPQVKTEPVAASSGSSSAAPSGRGGGRGGFGGPRGRGRGGPGGGRGRAPVASQSIAAGIFGGPRQTNYTNRGAAVGSGMRLIEEQDIDQYSDNETDETGTPKVIDIGAISGLGESAPTSLFRDRRVDSRGRKIKGDAAKPDAKGKGKGKAKKVEGVDDENRMDVDALEGVKAEPVSPEKRAASLLERDNDEMMEEDEVQDRDAQGRRLRVQGDGTPVVEVEEVNEAQKVDLSESESEEEEEDMEGDFVAAPDMDPPESKMFLFQFPTQFPEFIPNDPIDMTAPGAGAEAAKPDVKPTAAQLHPRAQGGRRKPPPPPEGRIGTLVVMKSGKVKMVLGDKIVMNVNPGVSSTFLQQLVQLDHAKHNVNVLGEINKQYIVTPDVDQLLEELFISGGKTPGEKDAETARSIKAEHGLVKMEPDY